MQNCERMAHGREVSGSVSRSVQAAHSSDAEILGHAKHFSSFYRFARSSH